MRRLALVLLALASVALAATASRVHAAPGHAAKDAPSISLSGVFDEGAKATYYTAKLTPPGSAGIVSAPTYKWTLTPPPDDPGCKKFSVMPGRSTESAWYHAQTDGCTHLTPMHNGTVNVQATVVLANDKRAWVCNASYFGTLTGPDQEGLCTIEAPAIHAVARPPVNEKETAKILADLFEECAESEAAIAAVSAAAALPSGGVSAVPGVIAGGAAIGCTILSRVAKRKAEDPPDRNFHVVATARASNVPQLAPSANIPYLVSYAFNALSDNITATAAYTNAFVTSINRASGAHNAGNAKAQTAQEVAALFDAEAIATLDGQRPAFRANLKTALLQSGVPSTTFSAAQLNAAQHQGLPASVRSALKQAGFSASDLSATGQTKATLTGGSFPGVLTAQSGADRRDAALMRSYVAFVRGVLSK